VLLKKKLRIACVQINAASDWRRNLKKIDAWIQQALRAKPDLIALPEMFLARGPANQFEELASKVRPWLIRLFRQKACETGVAFLLGSLLEPSREKGRYYNTSYLISEHGKLVARYRKIHLFDIFLKGKVEVSESRHIRPGRRIVAGIVCGIRAGLTVCYDVRFPELFRRLAGLGSRLIFVPANFTEATGKAHWEVLLRTRAIENQVFIIAPAQVGTHPVTKIKSFGTSLVIDPWGNVLARAGRFKEGVITADLDFGFQDRLRKAFPVLKHQVLR